jgi:hypothetical protein
VLRRPWRLIGLQDVETFTFSRLLVLIIYRLQECNEMGFCKVKEIKSRQWI